MAIAAATAVNHGHASRASVRPLSSVGPLADARLLIGGLAISGGIVAGMFLGAETLMVVAAIAAFVAAMSFPALGLVVLALMGPLRPPPVIPAPGFHLILVAAILLGCVYRLPISRTRLRASPALMLLFAFVLYAFVQQLPDLATGYAGIRSHDVGYLFFQLLAGLGTVVAAGFVMRGRSPYLFLIALLMSATLAAVLGIITAGGVPHSGLANLMPASDVASRATGPFTNPNIFGQFLAYAGAFAAGWFTSTHSVRVRAALLVAVGIMAYAVWLTLSRGAVVALIAGLVALAFARSRTLGFAAVGAGLLLVTVGYPVFVEWRLTIETGSPSSAAAAELAASDQGRLGAVLAGPALFATSPIFGIGFGQYEYMSALVTDVGAGLVAHNWYGTVLAEQGLLGIVLWLLMLIAVGTWLRSRPARPRSVGFAVFGAFVVGSLFLQPPTSLQLSVLPAIVLTGALVSDWGGRPAAFGRRGQTTLAGATDRAGRASRLVKPADSPIAAATAWVGQRNPAESRLGEPIGSEMPRSDSDFLPFDLFIER